MGPDPKILLVNATTVLTDQEISSWVPLLQDQIVQDFAPHWGRALTVLDFVPRGVAPAGDAWWVVVTDTADIAGAEGYHDLTTTGLPMGKIFAKTAMQVGDPVSSVASHELLEMLADSDIATCVQYGTVFYAREACDPCERTAQGYSRSGVALSDFVFPSYFDTDAMTGVFDFTGHVTAPRQILAGGYQLVLDLDHVHRGWQQVFGASPVAALAVPPIGSRRERRMRRHRGEPWQVSTVAVA